MRREKISEALSMLEESYVLEALELSSGKQGIKRRSYGTGNVWRTVLIAAVISIFFAASAFAIGYSIHLRRQQELRERMDIDENNVASYVEYPVPEETENSTEPSVTLLSASVRADAVDLFFNVTNAEPLYTPVGNQDIVCSIGTGWGMARPVIRGNAPVERPTMENIMYDSETNTMTLCCTFGLTQLEGQENWEVTVQQWPWETELGRFSFTVPQREARLCMFPVPLKFTNDELDKEGRVLGVELTAAGMSFLLEFEDAEKLFHSLRCYEELSPEEQEYSRLINGPWARAMDKVSRGTLHMNDGTDFEVLGCNTVDYRDGIVREYADWNMQTIDIHAVIAITIGETRIELN